MAVAQQEVEQAKVLAQEGKHEAAVALLSQLIQREPSNVEAWLALSDVVDDPERAEYCLQKVLTLDPGNATALEKLSNSKGGSLSVGAVGGLNQAERDPAPSHTSYDSDSDQMESPEPVPQAPVDPPELHEDVPVPEILAEATFKDPAELDGAPGNEAQFAPAAPTPEAIAQEPAKRSSASRTDLILIGLTVLAGIVLCALLSAALII
jgi:tetratricopeptide (TPR) repeat protein